MGEDGESVGMGGLLHEELSEVIIGAAMEVLNVLKPVLNFLSG